MSRAGKIEEQARVAKERRQKKMLIALAPVLLLILAWQGPGMLKAFSGGGTATTTAGATTLMSTVAAPDPTGAAPTTAGTPGVVATPSGSSTLPESDDAVVAGEGQLVRFDRFHGKDPFQQQVEDTAAVVPPADNGGSSGGSVTPVPPSDDPPPDDDPSAFTTATVNVNGVEEELTKGATFPQSDPLFRLVSVSAKSVKIGLVSGKFSNGQETVTVKVGKTVTLVSQPDGVRYVIKLVGTGTA